MTVTLDVAYRIGFLITRIPYFCAQMKIITLTLDEGTVNWARIHAARRDMSLSRFVGELLDKTMQESREYEMAMQRCLAKRPVELKRSGDLYPIREGVNSSDD